MLPVVMLDNSGSSRAEITTESFGHCAFQCTLVTIKRQPTMFTSYYKNENVLHLTQTGKVQPRSLTTTALSTSILTCFRTHESYFTLFMPFWTTSLACYKFLQIFRRIYLEMFSSDILFQLKIPSKTKIIIYSFFVAKNVYRWTTCRWLAIVWSFIYNKPERSNLKRDLQWVKARSSCW